MIGDRKMCAARTILLLCVTGVLPLFLDGTLKLAGHITSVKTIQLLNQLCNESQDNSTLSRDACYGCFFRASSHQPGYPFLLSMAKCAGNYLNNSDYGHCAEYLENATTTISSSTNPTLVYCTFLECVRQVNKDSLIRECVTEAVRLMANFTGASDHFAQLFVNTSACILAKTRCADPNPITGVARGIEWKESTYFNALFVNSDYNVNFVQLPFGAFPPDECHKYRNLEVAAWPSVRC